VREWAHCPGNPFSVEPNYYHYDSPWEVFTWLELKLVARRLLQPTRRSTVTTFTPALALGVVRTVTPVVLPLVKLAVSALVYTAQRVAALAAAPRKLPKGNLFKKPGYL
jgi:hypothetical protein